MKRLLWLPLLVTAHLWASCTGSSPTWTCTPDQPSVASGIASSSPGHTINVSAGSATWTTGVTLNGRTLSGAGSGRIIAYDNGTETPTIGTGTQTFTLAGFSPGFSGSNLTGTLRIFEANSQTNWMHGTVTSYNSGTMVLTMNITSTGGSGSTHRWLVSTLPSTIITDNTSSGLITMQENATYHTKLTGFQIIAGSN